MHRSNYIRVLNFIGDLIIINISFLVSYFLVFAHPLKFNNNSYTLLLLYYNVAWWFVISILKGNKIYRVSGILDVINQTLRVFVLYFLVIIAINGINNNFTFYTRLFAYSFLMIGVLIPLWRIISIKIIRWYRLKGGNFRRVIVIGRIITSQEIVKFFRVNKEYGYNLLQIFEPESDSQFSGYVQRVGEFCKENMVDEVYCMLSDFSNSQIQEIVNCAERQFIKIKYLPTNIGIGTNNFKVDFYGYIPVFIHRPIPLDDFVNQIIKRIFDILFSLFVIVFILLWLIPILYVIIRLDSKGKVFYKQKRSGLMNNHFTCYKLRSMYVRDTDVFVQATANDSRVTRVGKYLRKYNLDELPQFFNVLLGNMSVVGPRPHPLDLDNSYRDEIDKYMIRHFVKPGITGLAQISGFRGETKDTEAMHGRIQHDVFYLENWSFLLDIKITFLTVWNAIKGDKKAF